MPEHYLLSLAESAGSLLGMLIQSVGENSADVVEGIQGAAGNAGVAQGEIVPDAGQLSVPEVVGGDFDPQTGDYTDGSVDPAAEATGVEAVPPPPKGPQSIVESLLGNPLLIFGTLMLLMYVFLLNPDRRKQADLAKKRAALKKNDRVVTTGGILGTVVSVSADSDEITLRIDESNNTRMRILKSAIASVLDSGKDKTESSQKSDNGSPPSK